MMKKKLAIGPVRLAGRCCCWPALLTGCGQKDTAPEVEGRRARRGDHSRARHPGGHRRGHRRARGLPGPSMSSARRRAGSASSVAMWATGVEAGELLAGIEQQVARQGPGSGRGAASGRRVALHHGLQRFPDGTRRFSPATTSPPVTHDNSRLNYQAALADLRNARAGQTLAQRQLNETDIRAPFGGLVAQRLCELGAYINPGQAAVPRGGDIGLAAPAPGHRSARTWPACSRARRCRSPATPWSVASSAAGSGRSRRRRIPQTRTFKVEVVLANPVGGPLRDGLVVPRAIGAGPAA